MINICAIVMLFPKQKNDDSQILKWIPMIIIKNISTKITNARKIIIISDISLKTIKLNESGNLKFCPEL